VDLIRTLRELWNCIPLRRKGAAIITIPTICLFLFLGTSSYLRYQAQAARRYVSHTQEVLLESNSLLVALLSAETGVRGYESTNDKTFLDSYYAALHSLPSSLRRLKSLVRDNPEQTRRILVIEQEVQQELKLLRQTIQYTESPAADIDLISKAALLTQAKAGMDQLRLSIAHFQVAERRLLEMRQQVLRQQELTRNWVQLCMTIISILASLTAIYLFDRIERDRQEVLKVMQLQAQDVVQLNSILAQTNVMLGDRNQELDQFAYVTSHDLKAPLRAIANLAEWIEEDLEGQVSPEVKQHIHLMQKRVQRMDALINGLLEYSRVGRAKVSDETVNVAELLEEIIDLLDPPADFKITIDSMPTLQTRRLLLNQVFSNLISNAIKHCDRSHGTIQVTAEEKDKFYQFAVSDDGPGIAPEHRDKIFTIFQTLEARDKTENTGIGLSIVKKIVEAEGGKVWVESKLGAGATFYFTWHKQAPWKANLSKHSTGLIPSTL
jgi:signal transduction histidine kinase